jgi:lipoprotein-anchoring transpeptidase ErfK/SrfK
LNSGPVLKTIAALVVVAGVASTAVPATARLHPIAPGVSVGGASVGGMIALPATARVRDRALRPLTITYRSRTWTLSPEQFGARPALDTSINRALTAAPHSRIALRVAYSKAAVARWVGRVAAELYRAPQNAALLGATVAGPTFRPAHAGLLVDEDAVSRAIAQQLVAGTRTPIPLETERIAPARTADDFRSIVVIDRAANTLRLFHGRDLVRRFRVATGQPAYPTPSGFFHVVDKQLNPWWTPPNSPWAVGAKPIPPGPGNPLGTRWIGLSVPGVGIHGTPSDYSIGYSESHGCIRMHIPEAEWLFERVSVGTPVVIL